jgi:hypothetical protein
VKERLEKIKPGKEVVLSVVIVACDSGLALMSSLIGPWLNTHALMIRPRHTFDVQRFALFFGVPRHRCYYRQISDTVAMCGLQMCEYITG